MEQKYINPTVESVDFKSATTISSSVTTGVDNTPSRSDDEKVTHVTSMLLRTL